MKKLLEAFIKSNIPPWLRTTLGLALTLVLLRAAGIPVGEYVDAAVRNLFDNVPGLGMVLRGLFVGGMLSLGTYAAFDWYANTVPKPSDREEFRKWKRRGYLWFVIVACWSLFIIFAAYSPFILGLD